MVFEVLVASGCSKDIGAETVVHDAVERGAGV